MKRLVLEVRKNHDGYAVYELTVVGKQIVSEKKIVEYDMLVVTIHKIAQHLQILCPDLTPEKTSNPEVKAEAPSASSAEK